MTEGKIVDKKTTKFLKKKKSMFGTDPELKPFEREFDECFDKNQK